MDGPTRYTIEPAYGNDAYGSYAKLDITEATDGEWVTYEDYEEVVAERDATASLLADCELKLDAAVRERDEARNIADLREWAVNNAAKEIKTLRAKLADAEKERDKFGSDALGYAMECGKLKDKLAAAEAQTWDDGRSFKL